MAAEDGRDQVHHEPLAWRHDPEITFPALSDCHDVPHPGISRATGKATCAIRRRLSSPVSVSTTRGLRDQQEHHEIVGIEGHSCDCDVPATPAQRERVHGSGRKTGDHAVHARFNGVVREHGIDRKQPQVHSGPRSRDSADIDHVAPDDDEGQGEEQYRQRAHRHLGCACYSHPGVKDQIVERRVEIARCQRQQSAALRGQRPREGLITPQALGEELDVCRLGETDMRLVVSEGFVRTVGVGGGLASVHHTPLTLLHRCGGGFLFSATNLRTAMTKASVSDRSARRRERNTRHWSAAIDLRAGTAAEGKGFVIRLQIVRELPLPFMPDGESERPHPFRHRILVDDVLRPLRIGSERRIKEVGCRRGEAHPSCSSPRQPGLARVRGRRSR